jgi:hypothetical protein
MMNDMESKEAENPNSPDKLFGNWLRLNTLNFREREHGPLDKVADILLAHILDFADKHGKLNQMYDWISSEHGVAFFADKAQEPFGEEINRAVERLESDFYFHQYQLEEQGVERDIIDSDETMMAFIDDFISENSEMLRYCLELK